MKRPTSTEPVSTAATVIQIVLTLAPAIALAAVWSQLPDTVPAHWGADGIDRWGSKLEMLAVPAIGLVFGLVFVAAARLTDGRGRVSLGSMELNERGVVIGSGIAASVVTLGIMVGWIAGALDPAAPTAANEVSISLQTLGVPVVFVAAGALLALRSADMPEDDPLMGEQYRAQRITGAIFVVAGAIMGGLCALVLSGTAVTVCQAVIALVAMGFAFILLRRWL